MEFIVLEQGFEGARLNTCTMSDLQTLAANLLANFATVRIPRCESLWISSVPYPSPKHRYRLLSRALAPAHGDTASTCRATSEAVMVPDASIASAALTLMASKAG